MIQTATGAGRDIECGKGVAKGAFKTRVGEVKRTEQKEVVVPARERDWGCGQTEREK